MSYSSQWIDVIRVTLHKHGQLPVEKIVLLKVLHACLFLSVLLTCYGRGLKQRLCTFYSLTHIRHASVFSKNRYAQGNFAFFPSFVQTKYDKCDKTLS